MNYWKCPDCLSMNKESNRRCLCGYEIDLLQKVAVKDTGTEKTLSAHCMQGMEDKCKEDEANKNLLFRDISSIFSPQVIGVGICLVISLIAYCIGTSWISDVSSDPRAFEREYWKPGVVGEAAHTITGLAGLFFFSAGYLLKIGGILLTPLWILWITFKYISDSSRKKRLLKSNMPSQELPRHEKDK